jgi:hypothetical protein
MNDGGFAAEAGLWFGLLFMITFFAALFYVISKSPKKTQKPVTQAKEDENEGDT